MPDALRCIIMGAAGRDFHDFQTFFRQHPQFHVCAFTAAQIPFIETRTFPRELAGSDYHADIPIFPEEDLARLIKEYEIDFVFLAYSDLSHADVMHKATLVQACGASFALLGPRHTQLGSSKPVIAVTAVRTGAGKSPLTQWLAKYLTSQQWRVAVIRHPMPYGDLQKQTVERLADWEDLERFQCTIEEREEYEPYLDMGLVIFAGVQYEQILRAAEQESDVILWDGGNNDYPLIRADFSIVVTDALRAGHEVRFYPGETNLRLADVVVINKVAHARERDVERISGHIHTYCPGANVVEADLEIDVDDPAAIAGRRVLVVEDGPTLTHGGMAYGAGMLAARKFAAAGLVDPRPFAIGSIADVYQKYPHLEHVLPALGYSPGQCREMSQVINASGAELVLDASPAHLERVLEIRLPIMRVHYHFHQRSGPPIQQLVESFLQSRGLKRRVKGEQ